MSYRDLREWLVRAEDLGELRVFRQAHWDLEIGVITEVVMNRRGPALLFDEIPGYRPAANPLGGPRRLALTLGLPPNRDLRELLVLWQEKSRTLQPVPATVVRDGPVMEHVARGNEVDLLKFPAPRWHEHD